MTHIFNLPLFRNRSSLKIPNESECSSSESDMNYIVPSGYKQLGEDEEEQTEQAQFSLRP